MRFHISSLFWLTGITALVCSIIIFAPVFVSATFVMLVFAITPAFWLTGAVYTRGPKQAFFLSGILTGFLPHVVASYYLGMLLTTWSSEVFAGGLNANMDGQEQFSMRVTLIVLLCVPGFFSLSSGAVAWISHRILVDQPKRNEAPQEPNYQVLSGRVTLSASQAASPAAFQSAD